MNQTMLSNTWVAHGPAVPSFGSPYISTPIDKHFPWNDWLGLQPLPKPYDV